jgi:hypothetical protein
LPLVRRPYRFVVQPGTDTVPRTQARLRQRAPVKPRLQRRLADNVLAKSWFHTLAPE